MKVNNINIKQFLLSFDKNVPPSVLQFLEAFACCKELREALTIIDQEASEAQRAHARRQASTQSRPRKASSKKVDDKDPRAPQTVIGLCPLCGGTLVGMPLPSCESNATRRVFYGECRKCPYYYEVFQHPRIKKYKKVEGGE